MDKNNSFSMERIGEMASVLKKHHLTRGVSPRKLKNLLEDLGPTYVKLGQIMSMRSDILPESYCQELTKLRTEVKPFPFQTVIEVIEAELERPVDQIFSEISPVPLGSASIAQVHSALLSDGRRVAVKVQRPAIRETMENDITLMKKASGLLKITMGTGDLIDFNTILDELLKTALEEMDFELEASNLDLFAGNQEKISYVTCPRVIRPLTTPRLLVMEYIDGIPIDQTELLSSKGYDMDEIGQKAAENYCKQILEDGFFHADPHPGNLYICEGKIAWLDFGMAGHLSSRYRQLISRAIFSLLQNDIYELKNVILSIGEAKERINHARLYTDIDDIISRYMSMDFGSMDLGELIERLLDMVKQHKIAIPSDITLLGRSMITMEGTLRACSPNVNMLQILTSHMSSLAFTSLDFKTEGKHLARKLYTSGTKSLDIPALLCDLLNITKNGQTRFNIELSDASDFIQENRRSSGRISLGIIAGALFIGSAIMCPITSIPTLCGIPWPAFIGFTVSLLLLLGLLWDIVIRSKK